MSDLDNVLLQARVEIKSSGTNVGSDFTNICCPFCGEVKFHCGINQISYWFKCFVCGEGGSWKKISNELAKEYKGDWKSIGNAYNSYIAPVEKEEVYQHKIYWRAIEEKDSPILEWLEFKPYLENLKDNDRERGLDLYLAKEAGLMIGTGKLNGYIVFKDGNNINARKFTNEVDGSRWWKRLEERPYLFGSKWVSKVNPDIGVITEGIFDCLRVPTGFGVAILGSAVGDALIAKIVDTFEAATTLVLALDRDANRSSVMKMKLLLSDCGYDIIEVDWSKIKSTDVKDLDELYLTSEKEDFYKFIHVQQHLSFL